MRCGATSPCTLAEVFLVRKTMRCGSFFASELKPVSILFFSVMVRPHGQAAVLLHAPEMDGDEKDGNQRKHNTVQHVKAQQGVFTDKISAEQGKTDLIP